MTTGIHRHFNERDEAADVLADLSRITLRRSNINRHT